MKALKLVALGIVLVFASSAQAQISVHLNIGSPPAWGPSGYSDVQYYYLPDVEAYYDVNSSMFIYYEGSSWVHRSYLPSRYRNYDLYGGYKVVMNDYHGKTPYYNHREYKKKIKNVVKKATTNVVLKTRTAKAVTIKMTVVAEITKGNNFRKNDYQLSIY